MLNNSIYQPFVLKIEPIEANEQRNGFINDKDLLITKLQDDLVQEKELNKKYTNEIASLSVKIDSHKEEEKRLLETIKEYKAEIDLLSTNLDSCQSLRDNFLKAQQEFIAFNQKCSNDVQKIKFNLNKTDINPLQIKDSSDTTNTNGKYTQLFQYLTNNESTFGVNSSTIDAFSSKSKMKKVLNSKQNQSQNDKNQRSIGQGPRVVIETVDDSTDQILETNDFDSSSVNETHNTDEDLNEIESDVEMSDTVNKSIKTINFKIRHRIFQKEKENFEIDFPSSLLAEFSSIPVGNLILRNWNEKQILANTRLQIQLRQIFLNKFNRMMYTKSFYKSKKAFRVQMNCTKQCNFSCSIIFNIKSKKVSMFKNGTICNHYVNVTDLSQKRDSKGKFIIEFINTKIWKSMQANSENRIVKSNMTELQLDEYNRIEYFLKELLLYKYNIKTTFNIIRKSKDGFSITLKCLGNLCRKTFRIFLNISTKECEIFIKEFCEHAIQSNEPNAENEITIYKEGALANITSIKDK